MALETWNFTYRVVLPDGTPAEVQQTDIQRGVRQDMTFFVAVRPRGRQQSFTGALHLSATSLTNLNACPGTTRREKATVVTTALFAWVRQHGLDPDFTLEVSVSEGHGDPCHVSVSAEPS
jgi:hypothetical protein